MTLTLELLPTSLAVCKLHPDSPIPDWAQSDILLSFTRTPEELSIVCDNTLVPENITAERGWRALKVQGPLDFSLIGILSGVTTVLAEVSISVFAFSTYNTDYVLLHEQNLDRGMKALIRAGYFITQPQISGETK
ncbi:MAG: ACT domain-containing protein [Chloroflexota bacterium]